jgi:hypothetical protein
MPPLDETIVRCLNLDAPRAPKPEMFENLAQSPLTEEEWHTRLHDTGIQYCENWLKLNPEREYLGGMNFPFVILQYLQACFKDINEENLINKWGCFDKLVHELYNSNNLDFFLACEYMNKHYNEPRNNEQLTQLTALIQEKLNQAKTSGKLPNHFETQTFSSIIVGNLMRVRRTMAYSFKNYTDILPMVFFLLQESEE